MKLTLFDSQTSFSKKIELEIGLNELIGSNPSKVETVMKKLYKKTGKISDKLMYLSEVAKRIEDNL